MADKPNVFKCDCELQNDKFDSLGTLEGEQQITHLFKCLYCGKEHIIKEMKTANA